MRERLAEVERRVAREAERADRAEARAERADAELREERETARHLSEQLAALSAELARVAGTPAAQIRESFAAETERALIARLQRQETRLEMAHRHLAEAEQRLLRQELLVSKLEAHGQLALLPAAYTLREHMKRLLRQCREHLDRELVKRPH